jgi:flagellar biogenesis protein FliO
MPILIKRYANKVRPGSSAGIRVEETASVGQANLCVVTVRGRTLLIGSTTENVTCLADLTQQEPPPPTFHELLEGAQTPEQSVSPLRDLAGQLDRLRRIGQ